MEDARRDERARQARKQDEAKTTTRKKGGREGREGESNERPGPLLLLATLARR